MIFGRKGTRDGAPDADERARPRPLAVLANGRSGGTIFLEALSRHPEVIVCPRWPHEQRPATYVAFARASLRIVPEGATEPFEPAKSVYENGRSPFSSREQELERDYQDAVLARLDEAARAGVRDFYRRLARAQGKPGALAFAEKVYVGLMVEFARQWPDARLLLLVRDPRDCVVSAADFFYREGEARSPAKPRPLALAEVLEGRYAQAWTRLPERVAAARAAGLDVHLVRYESLLRETEATLAGVARLAGLAESGVAAMAAALREEPQRKGHLTAASPAESIGRWRRELEPELQAQIESALGPTARALGYA